MNENYFPQELLASIQEHACRDYPQECCGFILGEKSNGKYTRVQPCRNAQDSYHQLDPSRFKRTSREAYFMDPSELLKIQKEIRLKGEMIKVIYHSHIDAGAYFSEEDQAAAIYQNAPVYPGVHYLVLSVLKGKVHDWKLYLWDPLQKRFALGAVISGSHQNPE